MTPNLADLRGSAQNSTEEARRAPLRDDDTPAGILSAHRGADGFALSTTYALDPWRAVHVRLRRERGPASAYPCAEQGCDRRGREWALTIIDSSLRWGRTPSGHRAPYSDDLGNYSPRCAQHARALDRQQAADRRDGLAVARPRRAALTTVRATHVEAPEPEALFGPLDWTMGDGR